MNRAATLTVRDNPTVPAQQEGPPAGLSHEEFMALSGLAVVPVPPPTATVRLPIEYREACRAIATLTSLSDGVHWANKADALASWAKMYHDDRISAEARRLKLHAYRRMGALADSLAIEWRGQGASGRGPVQLLTDAGLSNSEAITARAVAKVEQKKFDAAVEKDVPPSPSTLISIDVKQCPDWERMKRAISVFNSLARHTVPGSMAKRMPKAEFVSGRKMLMTAIAELQKLERALAREEARYA